MLLVHGLGASSHVFDPLLALGPEGLRLISFDLPCSGRSGAYCPLAVRAVAAEAVALLDRLEVPSAVVAGHSFGGAVAMELAARYPGRVTGLVVSSAPIGGVPAPVRRALSAPASDRVMEVVGRFPTSRLFTRAYLRLIFGRPEAVTPAVVDGYVAAAAAKNFYPAMLEGLRDLAAYRIPVEALNAGAVPTAVLWGDRDRLATPAQGEQVARALRTPIEWLAGTGHCVPEERPDKLADAIRRLAAPSKKHRMPRPKAGGTKRTRR